MYRERVWAYAKCVHAAQACRAQEWQMLTTADLPAVMQLDQTTPHECGLASCPDSERNGCGAHPKSGVPSAR